MFNALRGLFAVVCLLLFADALTDELAWLAVDKQVRIQGPNPPYIRNFLIIYIFLIAIAFLLPNPLYIRNFLIIYIFLIAIAFLLPLSLIIYTHVHTNTYTRTSAEASRLPAHREHIDAGVQNQDD